jgi:hypothetical protein
MSPEVVFWCRPFVPIPLPVLWAAPVNSFAVYFPRGTRLRPLLKSLLRVRTDAFTVELTSSSDVHLSGGGDGVPVE